MTKLLVAALAIYLAWHFLKPRPRMPEAEARAILGVGATAGADEIRAAHRRLVSAVHPDKGGSTVVLKADKDGDPLTGNGYTMTGNQDKISLTQPDGTKVTIDAHQVSAVHPAIPGIYAASVKSVVTIGKLNRGIREDLAEATALLRSHGAKL